MNRQHTVNGIVHFDIAGPQIAPLGAFYERVFGWSVEPRGPGYAKLTTPAGSPDGALVEARDATLEIGIVVADLTRSLETTVECGGSIAMPATDNGWVVKAQVVDPAGNRVTLIQA